MSGGTTQAPTCRCGHTAHWHSHGGTGVCEHLSDCRCGHFTLLEGASVAVEPLTMYRCPVCGTWDQDEHYTGGHDFDRFPDCHKNQRVPVRVFREEDVRPLWEAADDSFVGGDGERQALAVAVHDFPAPEEWRS